MWILVPCDVSGILEPVLHAAAMSCQPTARLECAMQYDILTLLSFATKAGVQSRRQSDVYRGTLVIANQQCLAANNTRLIIISVEGIVDRFGGLRQFELCCLSQSCSNIDHMHTQILLSTYEHGVLVFLGDCDGFNLVVWDLNGIGSASGLAFTESVPGKTVVARSNQKPSTHVERFESDEEFRLFDVLENNH
jgi:hypothetical protein